MKDILSRAGMDRRKIIAGLITVTAMTKLGTVWAATGQEEQDFYRHLFALKLPVPINRDWDKSVKAAWVNGHLAGRDPVTQERHIDIGIRHLEDSHDSTPFVSPAYHFTRFKLGIPVSYQHMRQEIFPVNPALYYFELGMANYWNAMNWAIHNDQFFATKNFRAARNTLLISLFAAADLSPVDFQSTNIQMSKTWPDMATKYQTMPHHKKERVWRIVLGKFECHKMSISQTGRRRNDWRPENWWHRAVIANWAVFLMNLSNKQLKEDRGASQEEFLGIEIYATHLATFIGYRIDGEALFR